MRVPARHWQTGQPLTLLLDEGGITGFVPAADRDGLPWLAPTLCDLQVNGACGVGFNDPGLTADGVRTVADACRSSGVGLFLPTVTTDSADAIERAFRTLAKTLDGDPALAAMVPGFHLEGPFLSPLDGYRGVHPAAHVRDPDADLFARWQDAAGGRIRLVTLAPERPGALPLIEKLTAAGVVVTLGHTAADADAVTAAVDAGAKLATHLGNGLPALLPRHANPLWAELADDRLLASVIADGHHLPAGVLRAVCKLKADGLILVSDASPLAGLPPGRYPLWGSDCEVSADGRVGLAGTPYLAGSGALLGDCVATAVRLGGLSVEAAITAAAVRPRELLGLPVPEVTLGEPAGLMLFDLTGDAFVVRPIGPPSPTR